MSRVPSPSMPTERQVRDAYEVANAICPGVRIKGVGPNGVEFVYPDEIKGRTERLQPFSGDA
jgi:hypothetical protein